MTVDYWELAAFYNVVLFVSKPNNNQPFNGGK